MIESPVLQELKAEWTEEAAGWLLGKPPEETSSSFSKLASGSPPAPWRRELRTVPEDKLDEAPDFRGHLPQRRLVPEEASLPCSRAVEFRDHTTRSLLLRRSDS